MAVFCTSHQIFEQMFLRPVINEEGFTTRQLVCPSCLRMFYLEPQMMEGAEREEQQRNQELLDLKGGDEL